MQFPESSHVVYRRNLLTGVICQLRFPAILKIDAERPARFQERIRLDYPYFQEARTALPREIARVLELDHGPVSYEFLSEDKAWRVNLTREFLALTCTAYERWADFKNHLAGPLSALVEEYKPAFYTRIGLRYQNTIRRSELGLLGAAWSELIQPHLAGMLAVPTLAPAVREQKAEVLLHISPEQSLVRIHHGLAIHESGEDVYLLDSDLFTDQKTEIPDGNTVLEHFNDEAARLFRSCITDRIHSAMEPTPAH